MKALNKIFSYWRDDLFGKKSVEKEYPYNNTMCRDKYNESIQDYLYESITINL